MIRRIIQFSDIHSSNQSLPSKFDTMKIASAISSLGKADTYSIVVSGDIANAGKKEEYDSMKKFFLSFAKGDVLERKKKHIDFLYAPGNHDIDFLTGNVPKKYSEYLEMNPKDYSQTLKVYVDAMKSFYDFSKATCYWEDPEVTIIKSNYKNTSITFALLNSAPVSFLKGSNDDKGKHELLDCTLEKLRESADADIKCLVMHHSFEWFNDTTKIALREIISDCFDLVILGHEHDEVAEKKITNNSAPYLSVQANAMHDASVRDNGFIVIDLLMDTGEIIVNSFVYEKGIYLPKLVAEAKKTRFNQYGMRNNSEFLGYLQHDTRGAEFDLYYCFPGVEFDGFDEKQNLVKQSILSETEFVAHIEGKKRVNITSNRKGGKTLMAKRLYCDFQSKGLVPVLFSKENVNKKDKEKVLKYAFYDQYDDNETLFNKFLQLPREKRVAIIDDADLISKRSLELLIELLDEKFGTIIVISKTEISVDIRKQVVDAIEEEENYKIVPFYYKSRKELIKKILRMNSEDEDAIEKAAVNINNLINSQIKIFDLTPEYIIDFANQYMKDSQIQLTSGKEAFSIVFEAALKDRIIQGSQSENPEYVMNILHEVAYNMHFQKKTEISIDEIEALVESYNRNYRQNVSVRRFVDSCVNANIFFERNNKFVFSDHTQLAYFVARAINKKASFDDEDPEYVDAKEKFSYVLDHLCFGINSDIVLFLSVITNNTRFLNTIISKAKVHFADLREYKFDDDSLPFLTNTNMGLNTRVPNTKDKEQHDQTLDNREKEVKQNETLEIIDEYDYDEAELTTFTNQALISLKFIEILAKTLPAFCANMKRIQQDEFVKLIYTAPNQLVYFILKDINDNMDDFIDAIYDDAEIRGMDVSKEKIKDYTEKISAMLVISVYHFIAKVSTSPESIQALNDYDVDSSDNYKLMNLMIKSHGVGVEEFKRDAFAIDSKMKLPIEKTIIRFTVWEYFLRNNVELHGAGEAMADRFFGTVGKRQFNVEQLKRRAIEERKDKE